MRFPSCIHRAFCVKRNSFCKIALSAWLAFSIHASPAVREANAQTPGWQAETRLTFDAGTSSTAPNNAKYLAVDSDGRLHIVWRDDRDRNFEIYHRARIGGIWGSEERLTFDEGESARPNLAADGSGVVHLAWNDDRIGNMEIYHRFWAFGAWSKETRVTSTSGDSYASALVGVGDTLHMVYMETIGLATQIMYRAFRSMAWSAATALTAVETGNRLVPAIDRGPDGSLHVAWADTRTDAWGDNGKIYYRRKTGGVWLAEELVTDPAMNAMRPTIAVDDSGYVHVAWIDARGTFEQIYYRRRGPGGWEGEIAVTNEPCTHYHPSIDIAGGDVVLAYWDTHVSDFNSEIFFRRKSAGVWWSPTRISDGDAASDLCCLIAGPNADLHVAWVDLRDGNREIYYREYLDPENGVGGDGGETPDAPTPFSLGVCPNPFRESTRVLVSVEEACAASIDLYAVDGRRVRSLGRMTLPAGTHEVVWDGRDDDGAPLAPGLYFAVVKADKKRETTKVLLLR